MLIIAAFVVAGYPIYRSLKSRKVALRAQPQSAQIVTRRMFRLIKPTQTFVAAVVIAYTLALLSVYLLVRVQGWPLLFALVASGWTLAWFIYLLTPPVVLILGRSTEDTGRVWFRVWRGLYPLRTAGLLSGPQLGAGQFVDIGANFRTSAGNDTAWRHQVDELLDLAPYILLDARHLSEHVEFEVTRVVERGYQSKTRWIVDSEDDFKAGLSNLKDYRNATLADQDLHFITEDVLGGWCDTLKQKLANPG